MVPELSIDQNHEMLFFQFVSPFNRQKQEVVGRADSQATAETMHAEFWVITGIIKGSLGLLTF